jgi:hypothetical protein
MNREKEIEKLLAKVGSAKKTKLDLSTDEDLSVAIMNLVSIEEHFFFTGAKTGKSEYYDLLSHVREIRKDLLKRIIKDYEGEVWCISKHLLAASMRLMEVGTKQMSQGKKKEAQEMFGKAYDLYSLFWGINLNLVKLNGVKKIGDTQLNSKDETRNGALGKLGSVIKKLIDCCVE